MKHPNTTSHPAPSSAVCQRWRKQVLEQLRFGTPRCLYGKQQQEPPSTHCTESHRS